MRLLAAAAALLLVSCASTAVRPGTGHLTFRLTWTGAADLDLYALSPLRERVNFLHRSADSGGTLDIDCNADGSLCSEPMENIFWPRGSAPSGYYKYWVLVASEEGLRRPDTYYLRVLLRGEVVIEHRGSVADLQQKHLSAFVRID